MFKKGVAVILPINAGGTVRVLQLTDCHLGGARGETLLGLDVDVSFDDVLDHIVVHEDTPDIILATGDIASSAEPQAYQRFYQRLQEKLPNIPVVCIPGNHDLKQVMMGALPEPAMSKQVDLGEWLLLMLDSTIPHKEHGDLAPAELDFLREAIEGNPDKHIVVCMHHQPVPVGCEWIDQYTVGASDKFLELVEQANNARIVLWGHVHQAFEDQREHVRFMSAPSTCVQFKPNSCEFALDRQMPGYRWIELESQGEYQSRVGRISERDYPIDYESNGY